MLNLLPKDQKQKIIHEYHIRFWVVIFALSLSAEIISLILLAPSFITAQMRLQVLNTQSAGTKAQDIASETANYESIVKQTNSYLSAFASTSTSTDGVDIIKNIVAIRGKAIKLNSFVYKTQNGQAQLAVIGTANTRQDLLDFNDNLQAQPGITSSDLPISDFVEAQNISFTINLGINSKPK